MRYSDPMKISQRGYEIEGLPNGLRLSVQPRPQSPEPVEIVLTSGSTSPLYFTPGMAMAFRDALEKALELCMDVAAANED
jgi:hypothetical protein